MSRMRLSLAQKVVSASVVAILLLCAPMQLAAQEREGPTVGQVSMLEWLSGLWSNLAAWLAGGEVPAPKPTPAGEGGSDTDGGGCLDPNGRCGG
jgi:hypothetical protein